MNSQPFTTTFHRFFKSRAIHAGLCLFIPLLALGAATAVLAPVPALAQRVSDLPALKSQDTPPSQSTASQPPFSQSPAVQSLRAPLAQNPPGLAAPSAAPVGPVTASPMYVGNEGSMPEIEGSIAAVVNDSVISFSDVSARMRLALLTSGLPNTPEVRKRLLQQVLRSLIDEQLQIQEAKRLSITVSDEEIQNAISRLAEDNKIPGGDMAGFLRANGIPPSSLEEQARAALSWNKVVQRQLRPNVDIGDDEIDAAIERIRANAGKQEYLVSEIFLPVDNPKDQEQIKSFADNLYNQIKSGTSFGAIARQFSQSTGAKNGGDIGWIQEGQLPSDLDNSLKQLEAGQISQPILSANGFHILGVREKRTVAGVNANEAGLSLQQVLLPATAQLGKAETIAEAKKIQETVSSCDSLQEKLKSDFPLWRWQDLGEIKQDKAPDWIKEKTSQVAVGHATNLLATDKGALMLFVCKRDFKDQIDRSAIMSTIGVERLELQARRLLRDLRRNAYLDIRLPS